MMSLSSGVSLMASSFLYSWLSDDEFPYTMGMDMCDFYLYDCSYFPEDPDYNNYIYFNFNVMDELDNYPDGAPFDIKITIMDLSITHEFTHYWGDPSHQIRIIWPEGADGSNVKLWVLPNIEWAEIDPDDNWKLFRNVGESSISIPTVSSGSVSVQQSVSSSSSGSSGSTNIGTTITRAANYGTLGVISGH